MSAHCCGPGGDELGFQAGDARFRRVLIPALAINAAMFVVEVGTGLIAGSASFQADARESQPLGVGPKIVAR